MSACAALAGAALFACLARDPACLPAEHHHLAPTLAAIAEQESGFRPFAIRDEATGESLFPATRDEAEAIARSRHARGRTLGLGLMQITHVRNWTRHWGSVEAALATWADPCANLRAGAAHFAADLSAALSRYNSGSFTGAPAYAARVMARAQRASAAPIEAPSPSAAPAAPRIPSWDVWAEPEPPASPAPTAPRGAGPVVLSAQRLEPSP